MDAQEVREALRAWAASRLGAPLVWGETDCAAIVVEGLRRAGAQLPAYPSYSTRQGAWRAHRETGGLEASLRGVGAVPIALTAAQAADVLILPHADGPIPGAGLVVAPGRYVTSTPELGVLLQRFVEAPGNVRPLRLA